MENRGESRPVAQQDTCPAASSALSAQVLNTYVMLELGLLVLARLRFVMVEGQAGGDYTSSARHEMHQIL